MNNKNHEKDWIGETCQTGDPCPIEGNWELVETGRVIWHHTDDQFAPLQEIPYKRAHYKYLGRNKQD